jgi:hypothetical protein
LGSLVELVSDLDFVLSPPFLPKDGSKISFWDFVILQFYNLDDGQSKKEQFHTSETLHICFIQTTALKLTHAIAKTLAQNCNIKCIDNRLN